MNRSPLGFYYDASPTMVEAGLRRRGERVGPFSDPITCENRREAAEKRAGEIIADREAGRAEPTADELIAFLGF